MNAPIADAMKFYSSDQALAFHTPGHKQGLGAHRLLSDLITTEGLRQEVSLMDELDDLHDPRGCIDHAQRLAAKLWHADHTIFFINGTTAAVQTMILSSVGEGDIIFVPRNAHRCVNSALVLSGARPIYLAPDFDPDFDIALNVSIETVRRAIEKYPNARALVLTSPNYYGVAADLTSIAELVHRHGMLLLIDEAHGTHLQFSDRLPPSAMDSGADMSAQSTHKLLGSLTQTSMLMIKSARVDVERVRRVSSMLQSTSPNYLLLASLDIARLQLEENGEALINGAVELSERLRESIRSIDGLRLFDRPSLDPTKITVDVRGLGLTGLEAEKILRHRLKIQCELSDPANVLFLITYADNQIVADRLIAALQSLKDLSFGDGQKEKKFWAPSTPPPTSDGARLRTACPPASTAPMTPQQAFYSSTTTVPLRQSIGQKGRRRCGATKLLPPARLLKPLPCGQKGRRLRGATNLISPARLKGRRLRGWEPRTLLGAAFGGWERRRRPKNFLSPPASTAPMTPRQAFYSSTSTVTLRQSIGKICAEEITFYPPGIPILCPGEAITSEIVASIEENLALGRRIVGAADNSLSTVKVIKE